MDSKANIKYNKLMQLENSMLMYSIYNAETLEKLINTVHDIHNTTSSHERLFMGQQSSMTIKSLYALFRSTPLINKFSFMFEDYTR